MFNSIARFSPVHNKRTLSPHGTNIEEDAFAGFSYVSYVLKNGIFLLHCTFNVDFFVVGETFWERIVAFHQKVQG